MDFNSQLFHSVNSYHTWKQSEYEPTDLFMVFHVSKCYFARKSLPARIVIIDQDSSKIQNEVVILIV
jgi:hypothetical protein